MAKVGKWIGAGLGFAMGGALGALLGFFVGSVLDASQEVKVKTTPKRTGRADFLYSLVVLSTAIMKADGKITRKELHFARQFFLHNFGPSGEKEALSIIREIMHKDIPVNTICLQIRYGMDIHSRTQLLYFLFGVAKADESICPDELNLLGQVSGWLGIDATTYHSVKSMYYDNLDSAYHILGIESSAPNDEVKKAYRNMAMKNHPDKVGYMGEDIRKAAEEKFMAINQAYEQIKKQRGMV